MGEADFEKTVFQAEAAQNGDEEALEALFRRYLPRVRRIVGVRLGKTAKVFAEVEDLVKDSLLDAFKGLGSFQPRSEGSFCHWLARCVENNVRDAWRRDQAGKRGSGRVVRFADVGGFSFGASAVPGDATTPS